MKKNLIFVIVTLFFAGCNNYETKTVDKFKILGETHEEAYVDYYSSFRSYLSEEVEIDGNKVFVPKYGILKLADIEAKLVSSLVVINEITDYRNQENAAFIDEFNLRKELEHDKAILEAKLARVKLVRLHDTFRNLTGLSFHGLTNENGKYDFKRIFWSKDLIQAFPFTFDKIDDARERKILEEIEHNIDSSARKLDRKELDPEKIDDPNSFVWKSKDESIELISYKISNSEKHENNQSDYIEGFRIPNGKREKYPALKIFFPQGNSSGVMVLDLDKEDEMGFGIPDVIESVFVSKLADLWNGSIIPRLFQEKETRIISKKPGLKSINVEIARIGSPIDTWEISSNQNGWVVPFKYKNDIGSNFNVRLKLKDKKSETELNFSIDYFAKEWTGNSQFISSAGAVIEYFKPKNPYDLNNLSKAEVRSQESTKALYFIFDDGTVESGFMPVGSNKFIGDEPYAIEYTEGQKRLRIEKDNGSSVFNKKKEVAMLK